MSSFGYLKIKFKINKLRQWLLEYYNPIARVLLDMPKKGKVKKGWEYKGEWKTKK